MLGLAGIAMAFSCGAHIAAGKVRQEQSHSVFLMSLGASLSRAPPLADGEEQVLDNAQILLLAG
jgi:hypothetical protein